ncbi:MAG: putative primase/helicase [Frankiales bacterium]|jgi:putative DNA primase/helicase|nr:putative primase/helicase [Frankiales bacterium]
MKTRDAVGDARTFQQTTGAAESITDIFLGIQDLRESKLADYVAVRVLAGRFCYCSKLGGWLQWDGRVWTSATPETVTEVVRLCLQDLHDQMLPLALVAPDFTLVHGLLGYSRIAHTVSLAQGIVERRADEFDQHPDFLNVGNGVVDLRNGDLLPHSAEFLMTRLTETDYYPGSTDRDWTRVLRALQDAERAYLLQRLGQAITGHKPPDDKLVFLQGGGANGKSTLIASVLAALGDYGYSVSQRVLTAGVTDHPTELMELRGARLAYIEELPEARRLSVARLKTLVGTERITARLIRQDSVTFVATHSLFVSTNYLPVVEETDHGTWRRLEVVRFPFTFKRSPKDGDGGARSADMGLRDRVQRSASTRQAALATLVENAVAWYKNDRTLPEPTQCVIAETQAWRADSDFLIGYFTNRVEIAPDSHVWTIDLLDDFNRWLAELGHPAWTDRTLSQRLQAHEGLLVQPVKRMVRSSVALSRPQYSGRPRPSAKQYGVWVGIRFREER